MSRQIVKPDLRYKILKKGQPKFRKTGVLIQHHQVPGFEGAKT